MWGVAALVAVAAFQNAAASYFAAKAPAIALRLDSDNTLALGRALAPLMSGAGERKPLPTGQRDRLANALRDEPVSKIGMAVFGLDADRRKDPNAARIMRLAERVSRREPATQVWLVAEAARNNDLAEAILHSDRALSVSLAASGTLFPALAKSLSSPIIDDHLVPLIRRDRAWVDDFVIFATAKVDSVEDLARVLRKVGPLPKSLQLPVIQHQILERFIVDGDVTGARAFAIDVMKAPRAAVETFAISPATVDQTYTPLTWRTPNANEVASAFTRKGGVEILAPSNASGVVLERTLALKSGPYDLDAVVEYPQAGSPMQLRWSAECLDGANRGGVWQQALPVRPSGSHFRTTLMVPPGCSSVRLALSAQSASERDRSFAVIDQLSLRSKS